MRQIVKRQDGKPQKIHVDISEYCNECPACHSAFREPSHCEFMRGREYRSPKGKYLAKVFGNDHPTHPKYGYYVRPVPGWCPLRNGASVEVCGK